MKYQATQVKRGKRRKRKEWPEWGTEWEVTTRAETERSETKDSQEKREGEMGAEGRIPSYRDARTHLKKIHEQFTKTTYTNPKLLTK